MTYLQGLTWAFALFNALRVVAYLPTLAAIQASGESSQHSLWTWVTWLGANLTMAAWLHEQAGGRARRAVAVNLCNASMCAVACAPSRGTAGERPSRHLARATVA